MSLPTRAGRKTMRLAESLIFVLIAAFGTAYALLTPPSIGIDELSLYNPVYMFVQYGKMTYPIYPINHAFRAMYVHPPVHYLEIGLLMKLGFPLFLAGGVLLALFLWLTLFIIWRGRFPFHTKVGLALGTYLAVFVWGSVQVIRPDLELALAWFAGLVAFESARLDGWNELNMAAGGFLSAWAAGVHYLGAAALLGIVVYIVWAWHDLGFRAARRRIVVAIAAACVFVVPYVAFFLIPNWHDIYTFAQINQNLAAQRGWPGPLAGIRMALAAYHHWSGRDWSTHPFVGALVSPLLRLGIPAAIVGPTLLLLNSSTRGIALAGLPQVLFFFGYVRDLSSKLANPNAYVPEFMLYLAGATTTILAGVAWTLEKRVPVRLRRGAPAVGVLGLGALAVAWTLPSMQAGVTAPHDQTVMDVARAAGQSMLGPHAFVGSAWLAAWYTSGGHTVYSVDSDLLFLNNRLDMNRLRRYLSYFDAIAVPQWSSGLTWNAQHETPTSWYVDGLLHLRGFYYDPSLHDTGSYLLLTARAGLPLVGYAVMDHAPYAFHERADGDYMFLTTVCAHGPISFSGPPLTGASFTFRLPSRERGVPARAVLEVMLVGRKEFQAQQAALRVTCRIREATQGMLVPVSTPQMLAALSRDDKPIRFYETVADAVRYAIGIAVPPDVLPVVR